MGADFRGDPASAMLEVLDPEQNQSFRDHYLDLPFDLSRVMFITTANILEAIPGPLRDRMEVIQLAGYTAEEKHHIARRYLIPRQIERNGLKPSQIEIKDDAIDVVIEEYTREAGVRNLERELGRDLPQGRARVRRGQGEAARSRSARRRRASCSASASSSPRLRRRTSEPGVATGLAWTPVGGEVLFVEATDYPGSGKLNITGQLGDVMKESAQAALSFVRAHAEELGPDLPEDFFQTHDLHVHVPAGAIPKDGPSAGVAMATALASLISDRAGARRHRDDRRADADRPGAADRRPEGEGARRPGRRHQARDRATPERAGRRRHPRAPAQGHRVHLRGPDRGGARAGARVRRRRQSPTGRSARRARAHAAGNPATAGGRRGTAPRRSATASAPSRATAAPAARRASARVRTSGRRRPAAAAGGRSSRPRRCRA